MAKLNDARFVREEYRAEDRLAARSAIYRYVEPGAPDARRIAFQAATARAPKRVLDVGCGTGEFVGWVARETSSAVVGLDQSERMVALTRQRGVQAVVGDVQHLPFHDAYFDCVTALWMLFHVPALGDALAEIARVLRPDGLLVAVTNGAEHLRELYRLLDAKQDGLTFNRENGEQALRRYFTRVDRRDIDDWIVFPSRKPVVTYLESSFGLRAAAENVPRQLPVPFRVRRAVSVFTAETAHPPSD
jgi:SAM-dependent methyltransferase